MIINQRNQIDCSNRGNQINCPNLFESSFEISQNCKNMYRAAIQTSSTEILECLLKTEILNLSLRTFKLINDISN